MLTFRVNSMLYFIENGFGMKYYNIPTYLNFCCATICLTSL